MPVSSHLPKGKSGGSIPRRLRDCSMAIQDRITPRIAIACLVSMFVFLISILFTYICGDALFFLANSFFPAISGSGHNTNTTFGPQATFWWCTLLASFGLALISGIATFDQNIGKKSEIIGSAVALFVVASTSSVNFSAGDKLIDIRAQALINIVQVVFAIAILTNLSKWNPKRAILFAIKIVALFFVTLFLTVVPTFYSVMFLAQLIGLKVGSWEILEKWAGAIGAFLSIALTFKDLENRKTK